MPIKKVKTKRPQRMIPKGGLTPDQQNRQLSAEIRHLKGQIAGQADTIRQLKEGHPLNEQEYQSFCNQAQVIAGLQEQLDQLALWLRNNKAREIAAGKHAGKSLVDTVIGYLSQTVEIQ